MWSKIKDLISPITTKLVDFDEKYMKIKSDSNLNQTEIHNIIIVVRAVFHENNQYYPHVFLDECLYKL